MFLAGQIEVSLLPLLAMEEMGVGGGGRGWGSAGVRGEEGRAGAREEKIRTCVGGRGWHRKLGVLGVGKTDAQRNGLHVHVQTSR